MQYILPLPKAAPKPIHMLQSFLIIYHIQAPEGVGNAWRLHPTYRACKKISFLILSYRVCYINILLQLLLLPDKIHT